MKKDELKSILFPKYMVQNKNKAFVHRMIWKILVFFVREGGPQTPVKEIIIRMPQFVKVLFHYILWADFYCDTKSFIYIHVVFSPSNETINQIHSSCYLTVEKVNCKEFSNYSWKYQWTFWRVCWWIWSLRQILKFNKYLFVQKNVTNKIFCNEIKVTNDALCTYYIE